LKTIRRIRHCDEERKKKKWERNKRISEATTETVNGPQKRKKNDQQGQSKSTQTNTKNDLLQPPRDELISRAICLGYHISPVAEHVGDQEVQQGPELVQVVLQRGAGNEEARLGLHFADRFGEARFFVLDPVRFVDHQVVPWHAGQSTFLLEHLVECIRKEG